MEEVKSKLHYLKTKILQYSEIPDNIRFELSHDIFKVEQALSTSGVSVSTRTFNEDCELYIDTETDEWVLKHKGAIKKRAKSKFECLLTKKALQKELGV